MSFSTLSTVHQPYRTLLLTLILFTVLDVLTTTVGLTVGCIELNPLVELWGLPTWTLFRLLLAGSMAASFFFGYRLCARHFQQGLRFLQTILTILDVFIIVVVLSGSYAIFVTLFFI